MNAGYPDNNFSDTRVGCWLGMRIDG